MTGHSDGVSCVTPRLPILAVPRERRAAAPGRAGPARRAPGGRSPARGRRRAAPRRPWVTSRRGSEPEPAVHVRQRQPFYGSGFSSHQNRGALGSQPTTAQAGRQCASSRRGPGTLATSAAPRPHRRRDPRTRRGCSRELVPRAHRQRRDGRQHFVAAPHMERDGANRCLVADAELDRPVRPIESQHGRGRNAATNTPTQSQAVCLGAPASSMPWFFLRYLARFATISILPPARAPFTSYGAPEPG